jgi:hypothetical protein
MKLSKQAIDEFKKIYFKQFKIQLTDEDANEKAVELLEFFRLIYKPVPKGYKSF